MFALFSKFHPVLCLVKYNVGTKKEIFNVVQLVAEIYYSWEINYHTLANNTGLQFRLEEQVLYLPVPSATCYVQCFEE